MKSILNFLLLISFLVLPAVSLAKEKIVFLVNTKENDKLGAVTSPYLDEYTDVLNWQQLVPGAQIHVIRANTNEEMRRGFELFMLPNPEEKEVVGLFIRSHGEAMNIFNEAKTFDLHLPQDMPKYFAPIVGHFSENARIVFNGCSILEGLKAEQARAALLGFANALAVKSGSIYANHTVGYEAFEKFQQIDVFNRDIPLIQRTIAGVFYVAWPLTLPMTYGMRRAFNHGYWLKFNEAGSVVYATDYYTALKP